MKKVYITKMRVMNGTVTMNVITECFSSRELAEKATEVLKEKNKDTSPFNVWFEDIEEHTLFEKEEDVPILNGNNK